MSISLQKASFLKRISAYLLDFILTAILATGAAFVVSSIVNYDACSNAYGAKQDFYYNQVEEKYGVDIVISEEEFNAMSEEERTAYNETVEMMLAEVNQLLNADEEFLALHSKMFTLTLLMFSLSLLTSIFLVYFVAPLIFKNGQTVGKKIFGLAVIRSNFVKISNPILFIRSIVGLYAMETMFPILMMLMIIFQLLGVIGLIVIALLFVLQIGVIIGTKTNSSIHDLLSDTVVVDFATQQIFETEEDLIAFKQKQHEEEVNKPNTY